jgi:hypothetical protein
MFKSIGFPELAVIFIVIFMPWVWGKILSKAGYSGWLGITFLIPLVNLIVLCWFAFSEWPVRSELTRLRQTAPSSPTPIG